MPVCAGLQWQQIYSYVWHDSFVRVTWFIHMYDMTLFNLRHFVFLCVQGYSDNRFIHILVCDMTYLGLQWHKIHSHSHVWHDVFLCVIWRITCVTWLFPMCDMTHSMSIQWLIDMCAGPKRHMTHSLVAWLFFMCDMTHSYVHTMARPCVCRATRTSRVWRDVCDMCDMTLCYVWHDTSIVWHDVSHVWHDSFLCVTWLILCLYHDSLIYVQGSKDTWLILLWHDSFLCVTWLIPVCIPWLVHVCAGLRQYIYNGRHWRHLGS